MSLCRSALSDDVVLDAHPRFDLALTELIENAISHHSARRGDVPATIASWVWTPFGSP